jgi:hypothetical protein
MYTAYNAKTLIKQPSRCCTNCGKGYKLKSALDKHSLICELIVRQGKKKLVIVEDEDDEIIPDNKQLYKIILELTAKYTKLENKMAEISKFAVKEKKKINILDWLNNNATPTCSFKELSNKIVLDTHINDLILHNSFNDILNEIINQCLMDENLPILAFTQKTNTIFIFNNDTNNSAVVASSWQEIPRDALIGLLNSIQMKISKSFYDWKQLHKEELVTNDTLCGLCDKALVKIMSPSFKEDKYLSKGKSLIYNKIKKDIKLLIEYEFDF